MIFKNVQLRQSSKKNQNLKSISHDTVSHREHGVKHVCICLSEGQDNRFDKTMKLLELMSSGDRMTNTPSLSRPRGYLL